MSTLRTFNLQHPESNNNNIQLAEGGGVSVTAGILTATNVSSTNVTTTEVTATNGTFSGNLSVGGVLSYEDVTNVDSTGIGTFRDGLHVTGGSVGIGTDNPSSNIDVQRSGTGTIARFGIGDGTTSLDIKYSSNTTTFDQQNSKSIAFETGNVERLRIASNGRIGVNNASPNSTLDIKDGTAELRLTSTGQYRTSLINSASGLQIQQTGANNILFETNGTEKLRITSAGNIGINQISPDKLLHISSSSAPTIRIENTSVGAQVGNLVGSLEFEGQDNNAAGVRAKIDAEYRGVGAATAIKIYTAWENETTLYESAYFSKPTIKFTTNNVERLRIDSAGTVKIGSNTLITPSTDADNFVIDTGDVDSGLSILSATTGRIYFGDATDNEAGSIRYVHTDNSMRFETTASERVRITSSGDLFVAGTGGMNTTQLPNGSTINVNGTSSNDGLSVIRYSTGYGAYGLNIGRSKSDTIGTNAAVTNGNDLGHITFYGADGTDFNQAAQITSQVDGTPSNGSDMPGRLVFKTSPEGSATPTERLRINSNGDLIQANYKKLYNQNNNHLHLIAVGESTPTVYVSDSGNDSTGDGTSSSPFRTLTYAWNHVPKVFTGNQTARIMIKGTSYTIDTDYYMRGGASGGNWQWGPAVEIRSESGSQIDVYLRRGWRFENVDGLRFNHLNFICDNANGYLYFNSCARGKIYNTCDMTVSATKGWSERVTYDNCQQFVDDMDIDVTSAVSSGLGGLVVVRSKSSLSGSRYITKAGSQFGNHAVSVCDDSLVGCNWDVTNFATGYAFGLNHYNAEVGGSGMLNGVLISNCNRGIRVWNNSFVRKYNVVYSNNTTNEDIQSGSFVN